MEILTDNFTILVCVGLFIVFALIAMKFGIPTSETHGLVAGLTGSCISVYGIDGVNFEVKTGERISLIGENGSGKSTILKIISGSEKQDLRKCKYKKRFYYRLFKTSIWKKARRYKSRRLSKTKF